MWFQGEIDADRDQLIEFMIAMILTTADITTALERELNEVTPISQSAQGTEWGVPPDGR